VRAKLTEGSSPIGPDVAAGPCLRVSSELAGAKSLVIHLTQADKLWNLLSSRREVIRDGEPNMSGGARRGFPADG
jgi:hypothetical protein